MKMRFEELQKPISSPAASTPDEEIHVKINRN